MRNLLIAAASLLALASSANAIEYKIDPDHTYPSFVADHMGLDRWRGKFNATSGTILLDKAKGEGTVELAIDPASIDYGLDKLNDWAKGPELFDVAKYPQATYKGKLTGFRDGVPSHVEGELTLHGVTRPVPLDIAMFKCIPHPVLKRELCGAEAKGTIQRDQFGLDAGKAYGIKMDVALEIQVEAIAVK
ncbi:MAG TPA: YceI family protein [Rhodanobacteraceae bacterium]|nr:YceI family protein [Rhodanobacteraceae bacterium]